MKHYWILLLFLAVPGLSMATSYSYTLDWQEPYTRTYLVNLETEPQENDHSDFQLPAWRPGRYFIQNFAAAVTEFQAADPQGRSLKWQQLDKDTWRVFHGPLEKVHISYAFYADNQDAGSSYLSEKQVYFNPVNLFMYIPGRLNDPVSLFIPKLSKSWDIATALPGDDAHNKFKAASYHEFADSPVVAADQIKSLSFSDQGAKFYVHFQGNYMGDANVDEAIIKNFKKICQVQAAIFGGYPFDSYHFIFRLLPYRTTHAVEHSNSASFTRLDRVTSSVKSLNNLYGVVAHEFWHAWNVKRIRPAALWPYDYAQEQYTSLHWFTEGVTDYYANLTLLRAGLITKENFLRRCGQSIGNLENDNASKLVSPSAASFNSWMAQSLYPHPSSKGSYYYSLGARLGLVLDLSLQKESDGEVCLDDVFQYLFLTYYQKNLGVPENGIQLAAETLTGKSWETFFRNYVDGTQSVDYVSLFTPYGLKLQCTEEERSGLKRLGILSWNESSRNVQVQTLHFDGDAYQSGLAVNDLIMEVDQQPVESLDLMTYCNELGRGATISMKVFRDWEVKELSIRFRANYTPKVYELETSSRIGAEEEQRLNRWMFPGR